ncbi:acyltransferase family protein [Colwellia sp. E2M01]|uniref:acyltransferase family protein n=1 Tax=Colwellia sp. E2M01 TaxID=2841561 RepID=UPI001C0892A9|nr:acyltransferase family protein [Colwellia sp. E2M01]MBU2869365.1 acyltransferase [Colwellia sp. E2M01]
MQFRKDINGLRAIAVIAVVLFHFNESWMPGGFAGVDVFFVISGFLMTGIIFRGIEQENFSILKFYVARANRIIPALAVLCLVLLVFGWFYLTPLDYQAVGKHVASSMVFLSNIILWRESGYFDAASHEKWLLHTWSLSVEWQFYIIYPLVLVVMRKFISIKAMKNTVLLGTILGFIFCILVTYIWPKPSYFLLPTRAWEMMIGGVAYLYPITIKEERKKLLEWLGLALIITSYFFISKDNPWPGYLAIFPVFGAYLIIQAQRNNSFITSNIIFQKLGAWSYSIYLWHWPLVVAIYYFSLNEIYIYLGIALSVFLGFLSNKYIEKIKFRNNFGNLFSYLKCKPAYMVVIVGVIGSLVLKTVGFENHYPKNVIIASKEEMNMNPRRDECHITTGKVPECIYGSGKLGVIVIGDSHAQSIVRSVEKALDNRSVMDWTMAGCRTIEGIYHIHNKEVPDYSCGDFISYALREIANYPQIPIIIDNRYNILLLGPNEPELQARSMAVKEMILASKDIKSRNSHYHNVMNSAFIQTICKLSEKNPVFILEQTPELKHHVPKTMSKEFLEGNNDFRVKISINEYTERNHLFNSLILELESKCKVTRIPVKDSLCEKDYCYGDVDGRPLYFDDDHLSEFGASKLIPIFKSIITPKLP